MKKDMLLILTCLLVSFVSDSQTLRGKVLAENGDKVPFATIISSREKKAATSSKTGDFTIELKQLPDTLVFSAVGYESYSVVITGKIVKSPAFEVVLLRQRASLSEVVVTGYGVTKKRDLTGSITTVSALSERRVAGLSYSTPGSSAPMKLRGISSSDKSSGLVNAETNPKLVATDSIAIERNYKAKLLTAGELNDFNKWKMWEDFSANDFKALSEHWNLYATRRYCVQLHNQQFAAIIGREVYLINSETKDTVWKAVTDVTGKAELWAGINSNKKETAGYVITCKGLSAVINQPTEFENGINEIMLDIPCAAPNTVDIAFVVDATGSMGDEIEYLKLELEDILKRTFARYADLDVNAASVFYRDNGDDYLTKYNDFNNDLLKTLNFLKLQNADGGGDTPEAVNSALHTALDSLHWSSGARAKLLFLVLDAPPHDEARDEMATLIKQVAAKGIRIIPVICSSADKSTEFIMRTIALTTNGSYIFLTDDSGIGNSHIKPTTDVYTVELLNGLLQRLIQQMVYVPTCNDNAKAEPVIKIPDNILHIKISPNPTAGSVYISSNKSLKALFVTDYTGKILMKLNPGQTNLQFGLSNYPNGTYLVKYITADNQWGAEKVVLVH